MPIIDTQKSFTPPLLQWNGHIQTIIPSIKRTIEGSYERERIILSDGDFLDLDWKKKGSNRLVIITHGLEGSSERHYVKAPAKLLSQNGFDVLAWNCRSCSGELNHTPKLYHHGDIKDISEVVQYALSQGNYDSFDLIGFSMGGNISVKYTALSSHPGKEKLRSTISISAPAHLETCIRKMEKFPGTIYGRRFYDRLIAKLSAKARQFPSMMDAKVLEKFVSWRYFDDSISAPINGYRDADEFYYESSSNNFLKDIDDHPVLIINAWNDPVLSKQSHPVDIAKSKENVFLNLQKKGGHTGFMVRNQYHTYAEYYVLAWLQEEIIPLSK